MTSTFVANRNELEEAFKTLRKFLKRRADIEAVLTFDNGRLSMDANGITVRASGTGSRHGQAYVNWRSLGGPRNDNAGRRRAPSQGRSQPVDNRDNDGSLHLAGVDH